jgi:hypothetical protein
MVAVEPLRLANRAIERAYDAWDVVVSPRDSGVGKLVRVASVGAVASGVAFAVLGLMLYSLGPERDYLAVAIVATTLALALHIRHLRYALAGRRDARRGLDTRRPRHGHSGPGSADRGGLGSNVPRPRGVRVPCIAISLAGCSPR